MKMNALKNVKMILDLNLKINAIKIVQKILFITILIPDALNQYQKVIIVMILKRKLLKNVI